MIQLTVLIRQDVQALDIDLNIAALPTNGLRPPVVTLAQRIDGADLYANHDLIRATHRVALMILNQYKRWGTKPDV